MPDDGEDAAPSPAMTLVEYGEALAELEREANACAAAGDLEGEARITVRMARIHFLQGTPREGITRVRGVLDRLPEETPAGTAAALYVALAPLYWVAGRYRALLAVSTEAVALARGLGTGRALLAEAEVWRGVALLALDRSDEGLQVLEGTIPLVQEVGDLMSLSRAYNSIAAACEERGEVDREQAYLQLALEAAERLGDPSRVAYMLYRRGWHEWVTGLWREAREDLQRALALSAEAGPSWVAPYVHYGLGSLYFVEGDWTEAVRHLTECLDMAERRGDMRARWAAKSLMAERDLLEGRPQAVRERLEPLLDSAGLEEGGVALLLSLLAQADLAMGDADKAETLIHRAAMHLAGMTNKPALVEVCRVEGMVATQQGRWGEGQAAFDQALELTRVLRNPYAEARVLQVYGALYARKGEPNRAEVLLLRAADIFRRLGARMNLEQVESALAAL